MLTRFFEGSDREVERFCGWLERLGPAGAILVALMIFGAFSIADMIRFVLR